MPITPIAEDDPSITRGSFSVDVKHDGTRTGLISATLEYLATAPPHVVDASVMFDGEMIILTAEMARAAAWSTGQPDNVVIIP